MQQFCKTLIEVSIGNFDAAQSHPDKEDLINARVFAKEILERIK